MALISWGNHGFLAPSCGAKPALYVVTDKNR